MTEPVRPVHIFVGADQVEVDGDVARVSMTFESAEDFARKFLRALAPAGNEGEGGASEG